MRVLKVALLTAALAATASARAAAQAAVAEVQVAPGVLTLEAGKTQRLHAMAFDASGAVIVAGVRYRWVSANMNVARVDSTGQVTAVAPGNVLIRAEVVGVIPPKSGAATVTVRR